MPTPPKCKTASLSTGDQRIFGKILSTHHCLECNQPFRTDTQKKFIFCSAKCAVKYAQKQQ
jgi:predicted nucleic acid-binding Zn ribbon protein